MEFDSTFNRRHILFLLAGGAALATAGPAHAGEARIAALIGQAQKFPAVAERIDFISRALIGTPYRGHTLIGGPRQPERFVTRDDCFDCVTFCETVLAAATVKDASEYAEALRHIRYRDGAVVWRERNHYFSEWGANNIAAGVCRPLTLPGSETIDRTLTEMQALGARQISFPAISRDRLLANKALLATGDIIGFLSQRADLDYFHVGFVVVAQDGDLWLRHAARSKGRVVDTLLARFLNQNRVRAVTLWRPSERPNEDVIG